jgi:phage shock protein C
MIPSGTDKSAAGHTTLRRGIRVRLGAVPDVPRVGAGAQWIPSTTEGRNTVNEIHARFADQGLVRPRDGRVLGGVIAGLGRRFGIDPWPARLLFVLILLVIPGSQILIYPLLWILMPSEETVMQAPQTPPAPPVPPAPTTA